MLCLKTVSCAGEFSVLCPTTPNQPCACPTLSYLNVTSAHSNLLGCYDPTLYFCSTTSWQWPQTADNYGYTALVQGSGNSNVGVCWNQSMSCSLLHPVLASLTMLQSCHDPLAFCLNSIVPSQPLTHCLLLWRHLHMQTLTWTWLVAASHKLSDWGTVNNAALPSAAAVVNASQNAIAPAAAPVPFPTPPSGVLNDIQDSQAGKQSSRFCDLTHRSSHTA